MNRKKLMQLPCEKWFDSGKISVLPEEALKECEFVDSAISADARSRHGNWSNIGLACEDGKKFVVNYGYDGLYMDDINKNIRPISNDSYPKIHYFIFRELIDNKPSNDQMELSLVFISDVINGFYYYSCSLALLFNGKLKEVEKFKIHKYVTPENQDEPIDYLVEGNVRSIINLGSVIKNKRMRKVYDKFFPSYESFCDDRAPNVLCDKEYNRAVWDARLGRIQSRFSQIKKDWQYQKQRCITKPWNEFKKTHIMPKFEKWRSRRRMNSWLK